MQKFLKALSVSVTLLLLFTVSAFADEIGEPTFEPYSPAYLEWLKQHENDSASPPLLRSGAGETYATGYIPFHIDLSHLADNPPIETNDSPVPLLKDTAIPSKYDLRNVNGKSYVTSVKNQNPYGTCWAHASIGAIESNLLMKGLGTYDLSEMHLAWFTFKNSDSSKRFGNYQNSSLETVLQLGGNAFYPTTLFSRLSGPTTEAEAPYPIQPSKANPDNYTMAVRLREVYYLAMNDGTINVNSPTTNRDIVKRRIMENGSVMASYYSVASAYKKTASNGTSYYYSSSSTNHAVQIVGWDDSYSRSNFSPTPSVDGAWLIKNSWGDKWYNGTENVGDDGYFWMSYAQYLTDGTAFIAEKADPDMKVYDYSPLGWGGTWGDNGSTIHTANVFKSERDNEKLTEVGFFTKGNNMKYEINVYTGMSSMPSSSPINGSSVSTMSGTIPYAGWHTVTLNTPVNLTKNQYFSVVVTYTGTGMAPVEMTDGVTANSKTEDGSFFSSNGSSWTTGGSKKLNATIKAYTVTGSSSSTGTPPTISTTSLPNGKVNEAYSATLEATGTASITWSVSSGSLPSGLSLNTSTGVISGTPTSAGSYTFSITAANSYGNSEAKTYTVVIEAAAASVTITTESIVDGYVGQYFSQTLAATSTQTGAFTWTVSSGSLPPGLTLTSDSPTGYTTLYGTPTTRGTYTFTLKASNSVGSATKSYTMTVSEITNNPLITTMNLHSGMRGATYRGVLKASGAGAVTWTVDSGSLPAGLSLNSTTGIISGTPSAAGNYIFTIKASNTSGSTLRSFTISVMSSSGFEPTIETPSLPDAKVGEAYSEGLSAFGTSYADWSISSGSLPAGLTLDATTGVISGTPTSAGSYTFTAKATNTYGSATKSYTIKVTGSGSTGVKPSISTASLTNAQAGQSYSFTPTATGTSPITWSASGLPSGLSVNSSTGVISGTPSTAGTYSITLTATNTYGSDSKTLTLTVSAAGVKPSISTTSLSNGQANLSYSFTLTATGTSPITWSASGLPSGLSVNSSTGVISGTPRTAGTYRPSITARNAYGNDTKTLTLTIAAAGVRPTITTSTLSEGRLNTAYSQTLSASGTTPIAWSISSGTLPTGLSINESTGVISGTPTASGTFTFTVMATNAYGTATRSYTVNVIAVLTGDTVNLTGYVGYNLRQLLELPSSQSATWTASGSMPSGISLSRGGLISGRPSRAGNYTVTVTASTSSSRTEFTVNFVINARPDKPVIRLSSFPLAVVDETYSCAITTTGTAPITLTVTGLPDGLTFSESTAAISGTPTKAGTYNVRITAENIATQLDNRPVTRTLRLTVRAQPPEIEDPGTLPDGIMGEPYSNIQFKTSKGTEPIVWRISGQPAGMRMDTSGLLSGTPSRAGRFTMTIRASNSGGNTTLRVPITILQKPTVSSARMSMATTDTSYTARFTATGTTPITWTIDGLTDTMRYSQNDSGTTATITGIPVVAGEYSVNLKLSNVAGSRDYTVNFRVRGVAPRLTATLTRATTGQPYRGSRIYATGTKPIEISYSISDSDKARFGITSLEDLGLSFTCNSADGTAEITGTPSISFKNLPITFTATNTVSTATRRVNFTSAGTTPRFTSPSESAVNILCKVGSPVNVDFTVEGSKNITCSMNSVSGFTLTQTGDYTATLSGTAPARDATTNITITATNADGRATKRVTIRTQTPPTITTASLPAGRLNTNYSTRVTATGTSTIRWTIEGTLPQGLRFSSGSFSGRPTVAGDFPVTIKATNTIGEDSKSFTISIVDPNAVRSSATAQEVTSEAEKAPSPQTSYVPETSTVPEISAETRAIDVDDGYIIAARLPEVSVDVSGMYDFEAELSENAPVGAKLYWLAYPDGEGSDDDEIAEFYDEAGAEIDAVPEGRRISVSVWLNDGVKYSPVIAVK